MLPRPTFYLNCLKLAHYIPPGRVLNACPGLDAAALRDNNKPLALARQGWNNARSVPDNAKDIVVATLGGSVALAGLLLIFSGFLFSQASSFDRDSTPDDVIERFKRAARCGVVPFVGSLSTAGISLWWLLRPGQRVFNASWVGFAVVLAITAIYGAAVLTRYL